MNKILNKACLAGLLCLLPTLVAAEGAVRLLACSFDKQCDPQGNCQAETGNMQFSMEPLQLAANGSGDYILSYAGQDVEMTASSFAGPFLWHSNDETHTLLANSQTRFLWHRLRLSPEPTASIRFMQCEFTQ